MGEDTYQVVRERQSKSEQSESAGEHVGEPESDPEGTQHDVEGPVFVISTSDISFVQGNTEAHYVAQLFGEAVETHVFAPLSSDLPGVRNHAHPFGGALGVFLLNVLYLPYWLYAAARFRPKAVYCYANVVVPPFVVRAVSGAAVVHDLQADPHDQMREFAERDGGSLALSVLLAGVKLAHRLALPRSDAVVTLSERLKQRIQRNYGVPAENVHVVPLGVDTERFAPKEESVASVRKESTEKRKSTEKRGDSDRLRVAYLGTIKHYRGLETVVEALARLDDEHRNRVQFDVFGSGDGAAIQKLRRTAEEQGVNLVYHGHVAHETVPDALSACDVAVSPLPELDSYQVSCPAKVFEYLAMGLPIVATRIAPHERHLTDGTDALLVEPDDPDSFAAAFEQLLDDPDALATMADAARETALDDDWSERFEMITEVVTAAQADRRQRATGKRRRATGRRRGRTASTPSTQTADGREGTAEEATAEQATAEAATTDPRTEG